MGAEVAAKEFGVKLHFAAPMMRMTWMLRSSLWGSLLPGRTNALVIAAADDQRIAQAIKSIHLPVIAIDTEMKSPQVLHLWH